MADPVFGRVDAVRLWRRLAGARVNYSIDEVGPPNWNIDTHRSALPAERPGAPERDGPWEQARRLVRDYEFSPPEIVRALYDPAAGLAGRDMLLEARFHRLHFYCGVRITGLVDSTAGNGDRSWGWAYETLEGHLERGRVTYEVRKYHDTGEVQFVASSHSQVSPKLDRTTLLGWRLFGRRTQMRFYHRCGQRLRTLVEAALRGDEAVPGPPPRIGNLVLAPSDVRVHRWDALALHRVFPG